MKLAKAIKLINPSAEFTYDNEDYDSIEWLNDTTPISKADIEAKYTEIEAQDNRRKEYPSMVDQLDDIYHNGVDGWKTTIKAVKDKYPK
ncbi:hypothetical protein [uncultured Mediterranean phage uvMED]|nr:hypothetical protein [uncultured Mediterranean phage uvMED]BAR17565.1 hypothetical protein [uncultured Mediterranean phage uvMED]